MTKLSKFTRVCPYCRTVESTRQIEYDKNCKCGGSFVNLFEEVWGMMNKHYVKLVTLCEKCERKVEGQAFSDGVQYALLATELCGNCQKEVENKMGMGGFTQHNEDKK